MALSPYKNFGEEQAEADTGEPATVIGISSPFAGSATTNAEVINAQVGDLLLFPHSYVSSGTQTPAGWSRLAITPAPSTSAASIFYKVATAADIGETFDFSAATGQAIVPNNGTFLLNQIMVFRRSSGFAGNANVLADTTGTAAFVEDRVTGTGLTFSFLRATIATATDPATVANSFTTTSGDLIDIGSARHNGIGAEPIISWGYSVAVGSIKARWEWSDSFDYQHTVVEFS